MQKEDQRRIRWAEVATWAVGALGAGLLLGGSPLGLLLMLLASLVIIVGP